MPSWTGAGLQKLLFNLLWIYRTKLWNFWKHPTKPHWMKCRPYIQNHILTINNLLEISADNFMHPYENNQLLSHFNQYFQYIQTVYEYTTRLATLKNFFLPRVNSSQGQSPSNSLDPTYGQKYLTISSFTLTLISSICTKITYFLGLWVQINKRKLLNSSCVVYFLWFASWDFFHNVLLYVLCLTDTVKILFIMGIIFICLSFDLFPTLFFYPIIICIVKQMFQCLFSLLLWNWISHHDNYVFIGMPGA